MQKIKYCVLEKLIKSKVTNSELKVLIKMSQYQDDAGNVLGVYYKDYASQNLKKDSVTKKLGIKSNETFYRAIRGLQQKGIISVTKDSYGDRNIKILDNDFTDKSFKTGYVSMKHDIFYNIAFFRMKANEKLMAMEFMKITFSGEGHHKIGSKKFFDKYTKMFDVSEQKIRKYMHTLKTFFSIGLKNKEYWITPKKNVYKKHYDEEKTDLMKRANHIVDVTCRRNRVKYDKGTLTETAKLLHQYQNYIIDKAELLITAITDSINKLNENRSKKDQIRELRPALVHKMLRINMNEIGLLPY